MSKLTDLPNIGKKTEQSLNEIGVYSKEDLQKMGSYEAWVKMKFIHPNKDICSCALFALEGALIGIRWHEIPKELKDILQKKADEFYKSRLK